MPSPSFCGTCARASTRPWTTGSAASSPPKHRALSKLQEAKARASALGAATILLMAPALSSQAAGLERIDVPMPPAVTSEGREKNRAVIDAADAAFENSELLRSLKEKSELNRDARRKELADTYCKRQAELGVGDCAGLRLIPGATKSGIQEKPQWLKKIVGEE